MECLMTIGVVLAFVSFCPSSAQQSVGTVVVDDGRVGIGLITGGNFGPGSFSINSSPDGRPNMHVYVQENDGGTQHIVIQSGQTGGSDPEISGGGNSGKTQLYPVQPLTIHTNQGEGGNEGGSGGGQIIIGSVVLNTLKHNRGNKPKKGNNIRTDELDSAALEATFGSNGRNNSSPNAKNSLGNAGAQGSIQIASITGGNFEEGRLNINNNNKRPGTVVPQIGSDVNYGNTGNLIAENEAQDSIGHGANNNDSGTIGAGSNQGQTSSGYNSGGYDEPWIWNR